MFRTPPLPPLGKHVAKQRKGQHLSLEELASRCGVSKAMLSQVETGKVNPTVAVVWKIAHGLGVSVQSLLEGTREEARLEVMRPEQYALLDEGDGCEIHVISPIHTAGEIELYLVRIDKDASLDSRPHFPGAEEFTTVLSGTVEIQAGKLTETVKEGETACYNADIDHSIANVGKTPARLYMVLRYARS